jgi:hypothetical protein
LPLNGALGNTEALVLIELWLEHRETPFPNGYGGKNVNDICITSLDNYASGCLHSYIKKDSNEISIEHYQILQKSKVDLASVLKYLDQDAFIYFSRLHDLCGLVIEEASIT